MREYIDGYPDGKWTMTDGWNLNGELFALIDSLGELRKLAARDIRATGEVELVREALALLLRHHGLESCSVFLRVGDELRCVAGRGIEDEHDDPRRFEGGAGFHVGKGLMGYAVERGRLQHARDVSIDIRYVRRKADPVGSLICAPMVSRDRVLGVVNAYSRTPNHFESWHEGVFLLFATALAHILDNNRVLRRFAAIESAPNRATNQ